MPALGARVAVFMAAKHHSGCWRALGAGLLQLYYAHDQCRMCNYVQGLQPFSLNDG